MAIPLRPLFAWALLGYAGLEIFFTLAWWVRPEHESVIDRADTADFTTLISVGFPILAVVIATKVEPALSMTRFIALTALIEYAAIIFLGGLAFFLSLLDLAGSTNVVHVMSHLAFSFAGLLFAALCTWATVTWAKINPAELRLR